VEGKEFVVNYRIKVKAASREAANRAFYEAVCGGDIEGFDWELIKDFGTQAVEVVNPEVNWEGGFTKEVT
jgi:hypothetical protein